MAKTHQAGFIQGTIYSIARLIEMHDQPTMAIDILNETGFTDKDFRQVDEYDLKIIREHVPQLPKGIEP